MNVSAGITLFQLNKYLQGFSSPVSVEWALVNTHFLSLSRALFLTLNRFCKQTDWLIYRRLVWMCRRYLKVSALLERKLRRNAGKKNYTINHINWAASLSAGFIKIAARLVVAHQTSYFFPGAAIKLVYFSKVVYFLGYESLDQKNSPIYFSLIVSFLCFPVLL